MNAQNDHASAPSTLTLVGTLRADGVVVNGLRYQSAELQSLYLSAPDCLVKVQIRLHNIRHVVVSSGYHRIYAQLQFDEASYDLFRARSGRSLLHWIDAVYAARVEDDEA